MKNFSVVICLVICGLSSFAQNAQNQLTHLLIKTTDETTVAYALKEKPVVIFDSDFLIVKSGNLEFNYPLESLVNLNYGMDTSADLENPIAEKPFFNLNDGAIIFSNLKKNSHIAIHSLNGLTILDKIVNEGGEFYYPLSQLKLGVYIVSVNNIAYKFIKK